MARNAFEKGAIFSFKDVISFSPKAVVSKQVLKKNAGNITLFAFDKNEGLSEHTTPYDALITIVEGNAEIVIDKDQHKLNSGESIILPARIPHSVHAISPFKMVLIMIKS